MIVEATLLGAASYGIMAYKNKEFNDFKENLNEFYYRNSDFINRQKEVPKLKDYKKVKYGHKVYIDISKIMSYDKLKEKKDDIRTYFKAKDLIIDVDTLGIVKLEIITEPLKNIKYRVIRTKEHELLVGYNHKEFIKVDMNKFPHLLVGGETGSGKSRLMLLILTNLIAQHKNIDIFLMQIRKGDLTVFKNCSQVKYMAQNLKEARDCLKYLDKLCQCRDKKIEEYINKGIYNIEDWNNRFKYNKFKYTYIVLDEFAFFNPSGADTKEEKLIKKEILGLIKNLILIGRSVGVFIFTSLQKPTSSSIPTDIKAQLTCRISFKQLDSSTSVQVLGNANATGLHTREAIVRTIEEQKIKVPFINHDVIMNSIKGGMVSNKKYIKIKEEIELPPKENNNSGVIDLSKLLNVKV